jgi:hypothetical protein
MPTKRNLRFDNYAEWERQEARPRDSQWEKLLRRHGLSEDQALEMIAVNSQVGVAAAIAQWVRKNCRYVFVPEMILRELRLEDMAELWVIWDKRRSH